MAVCFCIGESCIDVHVPLFDRFPEPGELIISEGLSLTLGGSAAYTSLCLSRLGAETWLKIKVGQDQTAKMIDHLLKLEEINTIIEVAQDEASEVALTFMRPEGKGYIAGKPLLAVPSREEIQRSHAQALHIAGYLLYPELWNNNTFELLKWAKSEKVLTSLDSQMCIEPGQEKALFDRNLLKNLDVLFMDQKEVQNFFHTEKVEEVTKELQNLDVGIVSIKMGSLGSLTITKNEIVRVPAYPVRPVNTVGAGDIYNGAFVFGLLNGWSLKKTAGFANVIAGKSTTQANHKYILPVNKACQLLKEL